VRRCRCGSNTGSPWAPALVIRKAETWAAAIDYTVRKVNFHELSQREISDLYGVSPSTVRAYHNDLVQTLDIMPCDYRYFRVTTTVGQARGSGSYAGGAGERFRRP